MPEPAFRSPTAAGGPGDRRPGRRVDREPIRVLVIDAEEGMREGLRRILQKRGCDVRTASDGGGRPAPARRVALPRWPWFP